MKKKFLINVKDKYLEFSRSIWTAVGLVILGVLMAIISHPVNTLAFVLAILSGLCGLATLVLHYIGYKMDKKQRKVGEVK